MPAPPRPHQGAAAHIRTQDLSAAAQVSLRSEQCIKAAMAEHAVARAKLQARHEGELAALLATHGDELEPHRTAIAAVHVGGVYDPFWIENTAQRAILHFDALVARPSRANWLTHRDKTEPDPVGFVVIAVLALLMACRCLLDDTATVACAAFLGSTPPTPDRPKVCCSQDPPPALCTALRKSTHKVCGSHTMTWGSPGFTATAVWRDLQDLGTAF